MDATFYTLPVVKIDKRNINVWLILLCIPTQLIRVNLSSNISRFEIQLFFKKNIETLIKHINTNFWLWWVIDKVCKYQS